MNILIHSRGNIAESSNAFAAYPTRLKHTHRYEKQTNSYVDRYENLLYINHRSLLHVSATYCDHLQGSVLSRMCLTL